MILPPPGETTLLASASVPEAGTWYLTDAAVDDATVYVRVPLEGEGHEDENALALAWERIRNLDHPSIPRPVGYDPASNRLFVASPPGVSLRRLFEHRTEPEFVVTPATVLDLGLAVADVLVHTHEKGRPHGHLSPDALWLTADGRVVVWGYAEGPDAPGPARWWSPERARGKRASGDADQWALGALLGGLVTARLPWRSDDPITEARVGDASHLASPVLDQWKPLGRLVERMLAAEPRDRFPSIHPVRQSLAALRQRVVGEGDLPALGEKLARLYGAVAPPAAPSAPALVRAPPSAPALVRAPAPDPAPATAPAQAPDAEPVTTVSEEPPPLDAFDPSAVGDLPVLDLAPGDFDLPTDFGTSPTRIPDELADRPSVVEPEPVPATLDDGPAVSPAFEDEPPTSPFEDLPLVVEAPGPLTLEPELVAAEAAWLAPTVPPEPDDPSSSGGIEVVSVVEGADMEPADLDWYERIDARRVAPWAVGALGVAVVVYGLWSLS